MGPFSAPSRVRFQCRLPAAAIYEHFTEKHGQVNGGLTATLVIRAFLDQSGARIFERSIWRADRYEFLSLFPQAQVPIYEDAALPFEKFLAGMTDGRREEFEFNSFAQSPSLKQKFVDAKTKEDQHIYLYKAMKLNYECMLEQVGPRCANYWLDLK